MSSFYFKNILLECHLSFGLRYLGLEYNPMSKSNKINGNEKVKLRVYVLHIVKKQFDFYAYYEIFDIVMLPATNTWRGNDNAPIT